jgi:hypothetical protein
VVGSRTLDRQFHVGVHLGFLARPVRTTALLLRLEPVGTLLRDRRRKRLAVALDLASDAVHVGRRCRYRERNRLPFIGFSRPQHCPDVLDLNGPAQRNGDGDRLHAILVQTIR